MLARNTFNAWAPPGSLWSPWAKPSLFADLASVSSSLGDVEPLSEKEAPWLPVFDRRTAIVLDVPGELAVQRGIQLARRGYRPVPLFNTTYQSGSLVDVRDILRGLNLGRQLLPKIPLPDDAPPAFLLDSKRLPFKGGGVLNGYDNRWVVLPQDFPSASKLRVHGIATILLWQQEKAQPADDLAHVLRRWQDGGLDIYVEYGSLASPPEPLRVHRPSRYKSILHRLFVLIGLRRNAAGGFGGMVPPPSEYGSGSWG